jgi:hypothetical protein
MLSIKHFMIIMVSLILNVGCADLMQATGFSGQPQLQGQHAQVELKKIVDDCNARKRNEPGLHDALSAKIPLYGIPEMTVTMMASTEKPTERERQMLLRSLEITMSCQKEFLAIANNYFPQPLVAAIDVGYNQGIGLGLELYQGHFTFGEYNRNMKEAYTKHMLAITQIEAELATQNADAAARAQEVANQRQQVFLNYLNTYNNNMVQQQRLLQPQMPRQITCRQMGMFTNCEY